MSKIERCQYSGNMKLYYHDVDASLKRAAARSLELSARGRRPGAQQVPHSVHVHVHRSVPPIPSLRTRTYTSGSLPRSLRSSHSYDRTTTTARRFVSRAHLLQRGIPPSLSSPLQPPPYRSLPLLLFAPPRPREEGRETGGAE